VGRKAKIQNPSLREFFGSNTIGFFGFSFPLKAGLPYLCFVPVRLAWEARDGGQAETEKAIDPINPVNPV